MKIFLRFKAILFLLAFAFFSFTSSYAQVQTPRYNTSMTPNSNGYYEYLPEGYNVGSQNYPLLLFIHGMGELGDGSSNPGGLSKVLANGPPKIINQGLFPTSFTVNNQTFRYIVISPQFIQWPSSEDIQDIINYLILHYRVDQNRIYLTGLSMGGGVTWEYAGNEFHPYAQRIAAIVPVCGASWPDWTRSRVIADADVAVWATHNDGDPVAPVWYTNEYISLINTAPAPTPLAMKTIWSSNSHDAWTRTYNPNTHEFGQSFNLNIYEWMLQYQRNIIVLPVILTNYTVSLSGLNEVTVSWTTSHEENNNYFTIERSVDGRNFISIGQVNAANQAAGSSYVFKDNSPVNGDNFYRLSQTDNDGKTVYFTIKKITITAAALNTIQLYPNPVKESVIIRMNNSITGKLTFRIINAEGKVVRTLSVTKSIAPFQQTLPVADLPPGYYTLDIRGRNYIYSASFIKQ